MKILKFDDYINEKLNIKPIDIDKIDINDYDPDKIQDAENAELWHTGDIIYDDTYTPRFYKIIRKTPKGINMSPLTRVLVSGSYNDVNGYEVNPGPISYNDGMLVKRIINKKVRTDKYSSYLKHWDGKPVKGYPID